MRFFMTLVLLVLITAAGWADDQAAAPSSCPGASDGWITLFNGKDLTGWQPYASLPDAFKVEDGLIVANPGAHGWIMTDNQYTDFELEVEFKVVEGSNSGVSVRAPLQGDPAYAGMELQILGDYGKPIDRHSCGAIYNAYPPLVSAVLPYGEWNKYEITLKGDRLTAKLNGKVVQDNIDLTQPGPFPKFGPINERAKTGHIGIQDHKTPAWFRTIRIKPL